MRFRFGLGIAALLLAIYIVVMLWPFLVAMLVRGSAVANAHCHGANPGTRTRFLAGNWQYGRCGRGHHGDRQRPARPGTGADGRSSNYIGTSEIGED